MSRRSLPIGIQTLREIREGNYYYVDKTPFALRLIAEGKYYFLSRPRRFGKSLFLDTLAELFSGNQALFAGLEAERHWDWSRCYPVIRLSFGGGVVEHRGELDTKIREQLAINAWYNGYNWLGEAVYNPFDVLLLFRERQFRPWWFETGTPTFLVEMLTQRGFFTPQLARLRGDDALLSAFDVEHLEPEALLWQTGYLSFTGSRQIGARWEYQLGYPNLEVSTALNDSLAKVLIGQPGRASELASQVSTVTWPRWGWIWYPRMPAIMDGWICDCASTDGFGCSSSR